MSKFKCTENSRDFVEVLRDREGRLAVAVADNHTSSVAFLSPSDAPALALAILEAAGVEPGLHEDADFGSQEQIEYLTYGLKKHVEAQERVTAEAEAQAKLEAEALELRKAWKLGDGVQVQKFEDLIEVAQEKWLAVARKAREMREEK